VSFLFPVFLVAGAAATAVLVALHFIVTREPELLRLPTARFAPDLRIQSRTRSLEPRHLLLLLARAGLLLSVAAALAGPVLHPPRRAIGRIVLLDRSAAVADPVLAADSARAQLAAGDLLIRFDTTAASAVWPASAALEPAAPGSPRASLSVGLLAALRAASELRTRADSLELVVIASLSGAAFDAATDSLRALWPARIRLIPLAARRDSATPGNVSLRAAADDPLRFAVPPARLGPAEPAVRLVRGPLAPGDSSWADGPGRVLVVWPRDGSLPPGWLPVADSAGGVVARGTALIAPFRRTARRDSAAAWPAVAARWIDGSPAALELPLGAGCLRSVAIEVPETGDLPLDPRFARLLDAMLAPCGGIGDTVPAAAAQLAMLRGDSAARYALAGALPNPPERASPWTRWLLLLAVAFFLLEHFLRRRTVL
jgi:hypothetical protein